MFILLIVINVLFMLCLSARYINYIQLNGYKLKFIKQDGVYTEWLYLATILGEIILIGLSFVDNQIVQTISTYLFYLPLLLLVGVDLFKKRKTPIVATARIVRLYITLAILYSGVTFLLVWLGSVSIFSDSGLLWLTYLFLPILVRFGACVNAPIESLIKKVYFDRAKKELDLRPDVIRIGITGSYGKTSVKNILATLLSKKYNVLASPYSYNTPMGFVKTIKQMSSDTQILIMEIGARKPGDVRQIARALKPNIAMITGIAPCHLESFGSLQNIINTKNELVECLDQDGLVVYNGANQYVRQMYENCQLANKQLVGLDYGYAIITDFETTSVGSEFELHISSKSVPCKTRLIGEHNIQNILMAVTVAGKLGVDIEDMSSAIYSLESVPHRLDVTRANGITIIDDSYNANPVSVQASLNALSLYSGRKVILCQGMVELGEREKEENYNLGIKMSGVADMVILVGVMADIIQQGLVDGGYNPTKIVKYKTLDEAVKNFGEILYKDDILLLMNDLPDNY